MEGAANIYNVLILIVIIFFRPVDKAVENKVDKMWGQEGEVCPARQRWHWFAMGEMELNTLNNHRLKPVGLNNGLKVRIRVD